MYKWFGVWFHCSYLGLNKGENKNENNETETKGKTKTKMEACDLCVICLRGV